MMFCLTGQLNLSNFQIQLELALKIDCLEDIYCNFVNSETK